MRRLLMICMLSLGGCLPIYRQQMWEAHPPADTTPASFPGITDPSLTAIPEGVDPRLWPPNPVKILIVHGMGDQGPGYADETIARLRTKLDLPSSADSESDIQISNPQHPNADYGSLHIERYHRGQRQLIFYVLLWSPLTRALETKHVKFDWVRATHGRVWLDRYLKRELLDHRLTDAVAYAGAFRQPIQYSTQQAICAALTDTTRLDAPCDWRLLARDADMYVITHSLGSIIFLESLEAMVQQGGTAESAAKEFIWRTRLIALFANQFPLFRLARTSDPEPSRNTSPALVDLFAKRDAEPGLPLLTFVAFTDPNDLLSYAVPDDWNMSLFPELAQRARFINVVVNNTWPILGVVAEPNAAHNNYWTHPWIIDLIANGSKGVRSNNERSN